MRYFKYTGNMAATAWLNACSAAAFFLLLREYVANLAPGGAVVAVVPWAVIALFLAYGTWRLARIPQ